MFFFVPYVLMILNFYSVMTKIIVLYIIFTPLIRHSYILSTIVMASLLAQSPITSGSAPTALSVGELGVGQFNLSKSTSGGRTTSGRA